MVVYLTLAAQYESYVLPFIVLLAVPVAILGAIGAQALRGLQNDVYCQIGLVMLIGLASKNAILIVEFAEQLRAQGMSVVEAAVEAARIRLRPILMTSLAFIFGVAPLVVATGAGSEMRQSLGTAVFAGMLGVTAFGLLFTPAFYTVVRKIGRKGARTRVKEVAQLDDVLAEPLFEIVPDRFDVRHLAPRRRRRSSDYAAKRSESPGERPTSCANMDRDRRVRSPGRTGRRAADSKDRPSAARPS